MRMAFLALSALMLSIMGPAGAQTAVAPAAVASSADVTRVLGSLNTTTTTLRATAARRSANDPSTKELKLAIAQLESSQSTLRSYTARAPVSMEYLDALSADADTLQRATATSQNSVLASQLRPVNRDLTAKATHANAVIVPNAPDFTQAVDTVAVTVKTRVHGVEKPGYFVLANPWYGPQTADARYIFGQPTPCTKTLSTGYYYFWVDQPGKPKLQKREVAGTNNSAEQEIVLDVE